MVVEPFYFGTTPNRLFGVYHAPQRQTADPRGVVLCYPMGQEYLRSHRAFVQLSRRLASAGCHVLRFDYTGCGDSSGNDERGAPGRWSADLSTAIDEIRSGLGINRVSLIGLRLGASLAAVAASTRDDVDGVVLWEPVINGSAYLEAAIRAHEKWLAGSFAEIKPSDTGETKDEVLGFPLVPSLADDLRAVDLMALPWTALRRVLLIEGEPSPNGRRLAGVLEDRGTQVQHETLGHSKIWQKEDNTLAKGLVPIRVLDRMVDWMCEADS